MIDTRLSFREHLASVQEKAAHSSRALARIMLNTRGPKQERRMLLMSVVRSITMYAAPIWADAMKVKSYARGIKATYRLCALRVCSAFRTVSDDAALVISGMVPIDLLAAEEKSVDAEVLAGQTRRSSRLEARDATLSTWQARWDASSKSRWTHRLIPNIRRWTKRKHGRVNFYLTQLLSGHGCFRQYLHRFGHEASACCTWCEDEVSEDAAHVTFYCGRFSGQTQRLSVLAGTEITPENLVELMLERFEVWEEACNFAATIMQEHAESETDGSRSSLVVCRSSLSLRRSD